MKTYKYQMHMHTFPCSNCAKASPEEMVAFLKKGGYDGGVITNHFIGGNTGIDRRLPWEEFVKAYEDDHLRFLKAAKKAGINIMFGLEQGVGSGKEILVYGLTPKMLYDHPELRTSDPKIWYETLKPYGVVILQAHPFRHRDYITDPTAMEEYIDGIEVYNACNSVIDNLSAEDYVKMHPEHILVSGGDAHGEYASCWGGIETAKPITNNDALVDILKRGAYNILKNKDE